MGCFCSKDEDAWMETHDKIPSRSNGQDAYCYPIYNHENTAYNRQRNQQNSYRPQQLPKKTADPKPKIGEYKCGACGRFWTSRYCWPDKYQNCKRCKRPVYAHAHREFKPSDYVKDNDDVLPHEMKLCQMCQQLGRSCTIKPPKRR